eukprot:5452768-Heterocapsa_arctica.AAC.1
MKFRLVEIISIALDVDGIPRQSTAPRQKESFGEENVVNQSSELKDTEEETMTLSLMVGGHVRAA